jgi:DHA2 family multidrug resistance protein
VSADSQNLSDPAAEAIKPTGIVRAGIVFGCMLSLAVQSLDATIAAVALPHMQGTFSASQDEIAWVITSYIVAGAIMTAPCGWLAGRYGRKVMLMIGVAGFTAASVLTGFAQTLSEVILYRFLQGAFGALLVPFSQSILLDAYPQNEGMRALSWSVLGGTMGPVIGPILGGWITEHWNWRWVFFINVPIGLVCMLALGLFVPETRKRQMSFDWFGFSLLSLFLGCFQLVLDRGSGQDWFASTEILTETCIAVLALYLFAVHALTSHRSLLDFSTLRDRNFVCGNAAIFIFSILFITIVVLIPNFLQNLVGDPVGLSGALMTPRSIGIGLTVLLARRLSGRLDPRLLASAGTALVAYTMYRVSCWNMNVSSFEVGSNGFLQGVGTGMAMVATQSLTFSGIAPTRRDAAATMFNLIRNFAQSIGVSVTTTLLVRNFQINHAEIVAHVTPYDRALQSGAARAIWNWHFPVTRAALDAEVIRQSALIAYIDDFKFLMFLALAAIPIAWLFRIPNYLRTAPVVAVAD